MSQQPRFNKTRMASVVRLAIYGLPMLACAQLTHAAQTESVTLDSMEVVEKRESYKVERTKVATKTDTPLRNIPQSISVVTDEQIRDQNMQSMADVVRYVPGVQMAQGEGHRDAPILRGNTSTADFFVDGMRDDTQYYRDLYNSERIEILKGPSGMIFGRGGTGGLINRVTKQANWLDRNEIGLSYGSWDKRRITTDLNQGVNENVAVRLTAMYEDSNSFRDYGELERWAINPTATFRLSDATSIEVGYEHFEDDRIVDRGVPSFNGKPLRLNETTFIGNPALSDSTAEVDALTARIRHEFANGSTLTNQTRYAEYEKFYGNVFPGAYESATNRIGIAAYTSATDRKNLINQTDYVFNVDTFGIGHTFLTGMEFSRQVTDNYRQSGVFASSNRSVGLDDTIYRLPISFANNGTTDANNRSVAKTAALYVQDQIELSPQWEAIVGVRYDNFKIDLDNKNNNSELSSSDDLFSPRAGLIYKPLDNLSFYTSYTIAHVPRAGEQLSSLSLSNRALDPEKFINKEIGVKWDVTERMAATAALYRLDRTDAVVSHPTLPGVSILADQRVKGVELGISGNLTDAWQITGGYAYQESEILGGNQKGNKLGQVPRNSLSLWNRYDFNEQWGVGLGAVYQSYAYATSSNAVTLPSFTRVDAAVYYTVNPDLRLQLNVENLFDEEYYASAHSDNNIMPGSPLAFGVSANLTF
ncbi:ferrichrome-iron receptor [Stutzerimonas stutzeri]|uniref:TonB-dependent receptor n=1 Tax=Stutzerimonas stutzeri TaxID=316 RepID=UPI00222EE57A|nr:TonB-dependent siderophore receptor [Stutzerimonas stutzeri]GBC55777.1 ferrichrome-iron receptor [Stutzerimonas stutzeri]